MDRASFEARLRAEGFPEIRTNELRAGCHNAEQHIEDVGVQGVKYLVGRRPVAPR